MTSRRVELLDNARANAQICALERTTSRLGKDTISHPPGGHDDLAAVVLGSALLAAGKRRMFEELAQAHLKSIGATTPGAEAAERAAARQREQDEMNARLKQSAGDYICSRCKRRFTTETWTTCPACGSVKTERLGPNTPGSLSSAVTRGPAYQPDTETRACPACAFSFESGQGRPADCPRCGAATPPGPGAATGGGGLMGRLLITFRPSILGDFGWEGLRLQLIAATDAGRSTFDPNSGVLELPATDRAV